MVMMMMMAPLLARKFSFQSYESRKVTMFPEASVATTRTTPGLLNTGNIRLNCGIHSCRIGRDVLFISFDIHSEPVVLNKQSQSLYCPPEE